MIVGVCGNGYTGSGAVIDLLKEYDNVNVLDAEEFAFTYLPDSIEDLEYHLLEQPSRFFSSDIAINRFIEICNRFGNDRRSYYYKITKGRFNEISRKYIDSLIDCKWLGTWMYDIFQCNNIIVKRFKYSIVMRFLDKKSRFYSKVLFRNMYFSINPYNFLDKTNIFIDNILSGFDSKTFLVLDQPFPANRPHKSMRYFKQSKAIIVKRDPRDLYILSKRIINVSWIPKDINSFISYYKKLCTDETKSSDILYVQFEDLIFDYDNILNKIEDFLGLDSKYHVRMKKYFNPDISKRNVYLFENINDNLLKKDIKKIENELESFLYYFD